MKKIIKITALLLLGTAVLYTTYVYTKRQMSDIKVRSMANTAAISSIFLSSVSHQYQCRLYTGGCTWSSEEFKRKFMLDFENENNPETWNKLKLSITNGTIAREFYKLWIYREKSPVIEMKINDKNKFVEVIISTEKQPSADIFY